jgi:histidinol-phosphate phosphatase family protein
MRAWPAAVTRRPCVPTAFLDRDGVLNHNRRGTYVTSPRGLRLYAGVHLALKLLAAKGYRLVVVTNQSAVARGYISLARAKAINLRLVSLLRRAGAGVDAVYFCPHGPDDGCACRKPEPGLINEARRQSPADMGRSFVVGDKKSDLLLARRAGVKGYLVRTGQWRTAGAVPASKSFKDLLALARAIPDVKRKKA